MILVLGARGPGLNSQLSPFDFWFQFMFQEASWNFVSCRAPKRNFRHCVRDSGLVVWFSLRVREVTGSIPGCTLFPFSFKVIFQEMSWKFSSCRTPKRNFPYCLRDNGPVVWFTLRVREVPGSIPAVPVCLLISIYVSRSVMKFCELPSTKKKLSALLEGQWSSGMIHT